MEEGGALRPTRRDLGVPTARARSGSAPLADLAGPSGPAFPPGSGITLLRDWPRRSALVVGEPPDPTVPVTLHRLGFSTVVTHLQRASQDATALGAFTFLLLTQAALGSDEDVAAIRAVHDLSPAATVLLQRPSGPLGVDFLRRALHAGVGDVVDGTPGALEQTVAACLQRSGELRERVLAVGAHPDDVELGCGGTLLDHRLRGDRVSILTLTHGGVGGAPRDRVAEAVASAEALGAQLLMADLPDAGVDDGAGTVGLIESVVTALQPTVVYVHSRHDSHQDHRAVAAASVSATRGVGRVFAFQSPSATNDFRPTQFVPIDAVLPRKVAVLKLYASQRARPYLDPELVVAGSRYWARHLGARARYAEAFEVVRLVGDLRRNAPTEVTAPGGPPGYAVPSYDGASRADAEAPHADTEAPHGDTEAPHGDAGALLARLRGGAG